MIETLYLDNINDVFNNYKLIKNEINLNKINVFVGENNSGKSRFLRELFKEFRKAELGSGYKHIDIPYIKKTDALKKFEPAFTSFQKLDIPTDRVERRNSLISELKKRLEKPNHYSIIKRKVIDDIDETKSSKFTKYLSFNEYSSIIRDIDLYLLEEPNTFKKHNKLWLDFLNMEKSNLEDAYYSTYIPVMRSLKKVAVDENLYKKRIFDDYFSDFPEIEKTNIFTGEDLYSIINQIKNSTDRKERRKIEDFAKFIQKHFVKTEFEILSLDNLGEDKNKKLIPNIKKDLSLLIGNEEHLISSFGDGIQSLIILTFPLFQHQDKKHLLFIDEPELNLHPGMQRLLLETLNLDEFKNTQVFISTHSNHFLNIATEFQNKMSVFSFKKHKKIILKYLIFRRELYKPWKY